MLDADVQALEALSHRVSHAATEMDGLRASIHLSLRSALWFGERADETRHVWESIVGPALGDDAERLRGLSAEMMRDVVESDPCRRSSGETRSSPA